MENGQQRMEEIFEATCGTWKNCNEYNLRFFLYQCYEHNIDPLECFHWLDEHKESMTQWATLAEDVLDWVSEHTSTSSPITMEHQ